MNYAEACRLLPNCPYPWELWLDGQWHCLDEGTDFTCKLRSFVAQCSKEAQRRGGFIRYRYRIDVLWIKFYKD